MTFVPNQACFNAAKAAAGDTISEQDVLDAFQKVADHKTRLEAAGQLTGAAERLRKYGAQEAERTRIAAAMARRHAALNILTRDKLNTQVNGMFQAGMRPRNVLLSLLEGSQKGIANARKSVAAMREAYNARFTGAMLSEIQRDMPHLPHILNDPKLDADILREMMELRDGGSPGVTQNADAVYMAKTFAKYAELGRTDLNKLGASIGKLDGWAGVQIHDDIKMIAAGKDAWVGYIATKLDMERTFPDGVTPEEAATALGDMYDTIITGFSDRKTPAELGQRVNPSNMAKSLGKSRVLHFGDAAATLDYREKFGYSNTVAGMLSHLRNSARVAANMETFGPNPEVMFASVADSLKRTIKEATAAPKGFKGTLEEWKSKEVAAIDTQHGVLRQAMDIATGAASRPVSVRMADIGSNIRSINSMAKLGAALPSSILDTVTAAAAGQFRGSGFFNSFARQWAGIFEQGGNDAKELGYLFGEGMDGILGHIANPHAAVDGVRGGMAVAMEKFFKLNGLTWWTDANRAAAARMIAAEMGMRAGVEHGALPPAYKHVLELHGIDAARWDVIRSTALQQVNGRHYVTPDGISNLPDSAFHDLAQTRIEAARKTSMVDEAKSPAVQAARQADFEARVSSIVADTRRDVQLSLLRMVADETSYGVIKTDARSQRTSTMGTRPGTMMGEAARMMMQFKGYPIAFLNRVWGRALFGARADAGIGERGAHIGTLLAGTLVMGYVAMTMKDLLKGYAPRNPADGRTIMAAFQQSGGLGIYGDFLFSSSNRFGGSLLDTLAGPSIGSASQLLDIGLDARDFAVSGGQDKFSASKAFSTLTGQVPFANLLYVKPALDYLFMNSLRESLSPGYLRRQETDHEKQYGQQRLWPQAVGR